MSEKAPIEMTGKEPMFPIPPEQALAEVMKLREQQPKCLTCKGTGRLRFKTDEKELEFTEVSCHDCKGTGIVQPEPVEKPVPRGKITEANIPKSNRKTITEENTLIGIFESAKSEYEKLRDEIGEWRDNMDGTGLENTSKYGEVETAADELDSGYGEIEDFELDELPDDIKNTMLTVSYIYPKRSAGRSWRAGEVAVKLNAVADKLSEFKDNAEASEMADSISSAAGTIEGVEFPGMY